ncbi:1,4-alpha-glucan-branching enzyme 3, chloroplastic/amyloplastic [Tanacetum coccineum]
MLLYSENHNQSISGGRSFTEILFGKTTLEQSSIMNESLLRVYSLHKRVEFPTESNDWDLLATPRLIKILFPSKRFCVIPRMRKRAAQNELATVNAVVEIMKKNYLVSVVFDSLVKSYHDDMRKLSFCGNFEPYSYKQDQAEEVENQLRHGAKHVILRDLEVEARLIGTTSIDTTCTISDVKKGVVEM